MREELFIDYSTNIKLHGYFWHNDSNPKAIVIISHGMAEHALRYDEMANYLTNNNLFVYAFDHIAHGKTASDVDSIGVIDDDDFIDYILGDMKWVHDYARQTHPDLPIYLFAHSMGSIAAQKYIQKWNTDFEKVALSGTAIGGFKYGLLKFLAKKDMNANGRLHKSDFIEKLTMGGFNKAFKKERPELGWLSRNSQNIENYQNDEYCGARFPVNYYYSIGSTLLETKKNENIQKIKANKVLMFSGAEDPVSDYGKAIKKLCKLYNKNGVDCSCIIIPNARHESFNEISEVKQQVFSLVKNFFL